MDWNQIIETTKQLFVIILPLITAFLGFCAAYYKYKIIKKEMSIKQETEINTKVDYVNKIVRSILKADRALIFYFHNGGAWTGYPLTGFCMKKLSCVFEDTSEGVSREKERLQNLLLSAYHYPINKLIYKNVVWNESTDSIPDDSYKYLLHTMDVKSSYSVLITSPLSLEPLGFISIHYTSKSGETLLNKEQTQFLIQKANQLSGFYQPLKNKK